MQSVTELTEQVKSLLESTFLHVRVTGEVSRPTYHSSGHLYFTLKDDNASISCVMFRGNNKRLKFRVEEAMAVDITGSINVYAPRGTYQINCVDLEPNGSGALALAYEQLKKELSQKGYFDQKRALPKYPKHIAVVTSKTGAALQDMLRVANARWPLVKITLINTLVQGENAKYEIANAIQKAQNLDADVIVLSRGGGSAEDLWAFNEREVAVALYESKIPTISAIGHAIDTLITDFVADASAPTPSAAMEQILPDINEERVNADMLLSSCMRRINSILQHHEVMLGYIKKQLSYFSPNVKINVFEKEITSCKNMLSASMAQKLELFASKLKTLEFAHESKNPKKLTLRGYAQITKNKKIVNLEELKKDDKFELHDTNKSINAKVI